MKKLLFSILAILILIILASSFQSKKEQPDINFPGTVYTNDNLYFGKYEVSNIEWRNYMHSIKQEKGEYSLDYKNTLPDTSIWDGADYSFRDIYLRHPNFSDFPVIGIREDQAIAFCKWKTKVVQEMFEKEKKKHPKMYLPKFVYRLPTKSEWIFVAKTNYSDKTKKEMEKAFKKNPSIDTRNLKRIASTKMFWPNSYGICAMRNNISEFVKDKYTAMGGNFTLSSNEALSPLKVYPITREKWLGFRYICEILE